MKFVLLTFCATLAASAAPPNVLFIAVDDLRPELRCYGEAHMITPHMDSLASQGRLFRNHYVAVPTCGASRYAMMTGLRPTAATDDNNAFDLMPVTLPAEPESWVDLLRRNGWRTVCLGKITHSTDGYRHNSTSGDAPVILEATFPEARFSWDEMVFDYGKWGAGSSRSLVYADGSSRVSGVSPAWESGVDGSGQSLSDEDYPDGQIAQAAIEKLREFHDNGTRFCLGLGFLRPHLPFNAPKAYFDLYNPATLPGPSPVAKPVGANSATTTSSGEVNLYTKNTDRPQLRHAYFASVSYVDAQIGKVLAELDALGLSDNTVVVLWGDHGFRLDDYDTMGKHTPLERALESPLIIRPPASLRPEVFAGIQAEGVVETVDIYPTLAELCGLTPPASVVGESLVPMLRNPFAPGKNYAYSRWSTMTTIRTDNWRLINTNGDHDLYDLSTFRYEVTDVSASNPSVVSALSPNLNTQGTRPGITYAEWAAGNPLLADPDGDGDDDGDSNTLEYGAGTDPLDPYSRPSGEFSFEDLTSIGLGAHEPVFRFTVATDRDDLSLLPSTSTNLLDWSFDPLRFLDAAALGGSAVELRFRLSNPADPARFFRFGDPEAP